MEWAEDPKTNHLWKKQAAAGNESKRTENGNGQQKWAAAINNRVDNGTKMAGANKNRQQQ